MKNIESLVNYIIEETYASYIVFSKEELKEEYASQIMECDDESLRDYLTLIGRKDIINKIDEFQKGL